MDAPIGAEVFASERRNHSETGVYDDLCGSRPVDRDVFADKLEKSENSFKFEEFKSFRPSCCYAGRFDPILPTGDRRLHESMERRLS